MNSKTLFYKGRETHTERMGGGERERLRETETDRQRDKDRE